MTCKHCDGTGEIWLPPGCDNVLAPCRWCDGTGISVSWEDVLSYVGDQKAYKEAVILRERREKRDQSITHETVLTEKEAALLVWRYLKYTLEANGKLYDIEGHEVKGEYDLTTIDGVFKLVQDDNERNY